jgi:hypothetical protein
MSCANRALLDMPYGERGTTLRGPYGEYAPSPGLARGSWKSWHGGAGACAEGAGRHRLRLIATSLNSTWP